MPNKERETRKSARRSFLKWSGISFLSMLAMNRGKVIAADDGEQTWDEPGWEGSIPYYWNELGYPVQKTIDVSKMRDGIIRARIEGQWKTFQLVEVDQVFQDWNFTERLNRLQTMMQGGSVTFGGAHSPSVATYGGIRRGDSAFFLNNTIKGMGLAPKEEVIDEIINTLIETAKTYTTEQKLQYLYDLYSNRDNWDMTKQVSLELFTVAPGKTPIVTGYPETHTFRNQMKNPISNICYLSVSSVQCFEVRALTHIVSPFDETIDPYESKLATFSNYVHAYYHGGGVGYFAAIYYVAEEYNNTPAPGYQGIRVASIRDWTKSLFASLSGNSPTA
jgi:hypothetical protein